MCCTGYEMARYKGIQASHLYEKSMHTLCTISEQPLLAEASTILDQSLSHTYLVLIYFDTHIKGGKLATNWVYLCHPQFIFRTNVYYNV